MSDGAAILERSEQEDVYNEGYTHEAQHAAHMLIAMWDQFIADSRCAEQFPEVKKAAEAAATAMAHVYQVIGSTE